MNPLPSVTINCSACKNGMAGFGEDAIICPECDGKGYKTMDLGIYLEKLRVKQKRMLEDKNRHE